LAQEQPHVTSDHRIRPRDRSRGDGILTAWRTEVTFQPHPDLPPLRMAVIAEHVTPRAGQEGYAPAFAAWCHAAAACLAARRSDAGARRVVERLRPRFEAWYGEDFAMRKLRKLGDHVREHIAGTLQPLIEREMLCRYGALIDGALAASLDDAVDDEGAA